MILYGNKNYLPMFVAGILATGLLHSLIHGTGWNPGEYATTALTVIFLFYIGITNFIADKIEKTDTHIRVKYTISGINWSKSWLITDIANVDYSGNILSIETKSGHKYKLKVIVNATESERNMLKMNDG